MRFHTILLFFTSLICAGAQAQTVTLKGTNLPLETVFDAIKDQTGFGFFYEEQLLEHAKPVSIDIRSADIHAALTAIFKDQPLVYTIRNKTIVLAAKPPAPSSRQPPAVTTGKVRGPSGETLEGVLVRLKGTLKGTVTNANGDFEIIASPGDILSFSYVGMESEEIEVAEGELIISLKKSLVDLSEIVVIGYGQANLRDVTGAIASVGYTQIRQRAPVNVFDALQGQAPGIEISQEDGRAAAQSSVIIRGIGTFGAGAQPLYIVDGAQNVNIDGINPFDIERVEILRDGASAAIYGARGANGVIIITTRRGIEGKPQITANALTTFGRIAHRIPVANADERRLFEAKIAGSGGTLSTDSLSPGRNADNNAYDFVTRTARRSEGNLTFAGGSPGMRYYAGLGYIDDESVIINQWAKLARFRLNLDVNAGQRLSLGNRIQFSYRNENMINERNVLHHALARIPYYVYYYPDGSFAPTISGRRNPLANALLQENLSKSYTADLYSFAKYKLAQNLLLTGDAALAFSHNNLFSFTPRILNACTSCTNPNNSASENTRMETSWVAQAYLNYDKDFGEHTLNAVLGTSMENKAYRAAGLTGSDFLSEEVKTINAAQVIGVPSRYESENAAASVFSRVGYNYRKKYQINGILRADASSRFGVDKRWGFFPSVSAAWIISDEPFMQRAGNLIANLKFRGGYGVVGNDQSLGDYDAVQQYVFGTQFYNGVSGVSKSSTYGNNLLSWETTRQLSLGVDLGLLKDALNISADYYRKTTTDLLYPSPLPVESGFSRAPVNIGSIENKGFELMVSASPVIRDHFQWTLGGNININRGLVKALANNTPIQSGAGSLTQVGQPLGNFYGWRQLRVFSYDQSNAFDENMQPLTPVFNNGVFTGYTLNGKPYNGVVRQKMTNGLVGVGGDVDWEDLDRNGIIDDADRSVLGNAQADFTFGLHTGITYKGLSAMVNVYGSIGAQIYNAALADQTRYVDIGDTPPPAWIYGSWSKPGDITDMPKAKTGSSIGNTRAISSRYIEDGSFIRLRNVRLQYEVPQAFTSRVGAGKISCFLQGNNLMTYSNYSHFDPEIAAYDPLQLGVDGEGGTPRIPRKNEIMFGLTATF